MKTAAIQHSECARRATTEPQHFPPLEQVTRPTVPTEQAAYYLNRRPQTLSRLLKYCCRTRKMTTLRVPHPLPGSK